MFFSYQELCNNAKDMKTIVEIRLKMVTHVRINNIKATAKLYNCSKNTVKLWYKRYPIYGKKGLYDRSRRPHNSPNKLKDDDINKIRKVTLEAREKNKYISTINVIKKAEIKTCSYETVNKYINETLGVKRNKKRSKKNNRSIKFKEQLKVFELIQIDIKYLTDIKALQPYFKGRNLAKYIDGSITAVKNRYEIYIGGKK